LNFEFPQLAIVFSEGLHGGIWPKCLRRDMNLAEPIRFEFDLQTLEDHRVGAQAF